MKRGKTRDDEMARTTGLDFDGNEEDSTGKKQSAYRIMNKEVKGNKIG